jgi:aryl carrier-like protein
MSDFSKRIQELSEEKRELLEMFFKEQDIDIVGKQEVYAEPRNAVEETLASIWGQILGVEQVGINDNFFDLGGDSIQCMQIIAKARQAGLQFTTNQLFENPTIAELAPLVSTVSENLAQQSLVTDSVPLISTQQSSSVVGFTPSDFPEAELTQEEINKLFNV